MAGKQGAAQLVQYIALRGDLLRTHKWPVGAMVAQGCHASTAVIHTHRDDSHVMQYLSDLDRMHKVVLEVPDEGELTSLSQELERNGVRHKLWVEQPENIATCLATIPSPKSQIAQYFKKYKLFK